MAELDVMLAARTGVRVRSAHGVIEITDADGRADVYQFDQAERGSDHKGAKPTSAFIERAGRFRLSLSRRLDVSTPRCCAPSERATLGIAIVDRRHVLLRESGRPLTARLACHERVASRKTRSHGLRACKTDALVTQSSQDPPLGSVPCVRRGHGAPCHARRSGWDH